MNFMLSVSPDNYNESIIDTLGPLETLAFGTQMLLLGILAVFAVLALIWILLTIFKSVFTNASKKTNPEPIKQDIVPAPVYMTNDQEIAAVIAAAVAMAESESENVKFRVVSFRRK